MNKKCFIDPNIVLSERDIDFLNSMNLETITYDVSTVDFSEIEYLLLHSKVSDEQLSKMENCQYIGIRAHNTDYVNKRITEKQKIVVKGLQHQHGVNAVAEHTFSLIFALTKSLITSHQNVANGEWRKGLRPNYELNNKKLGIIGNGKIGKRVAEFGKAFGMEILIAGKKSGNKPEEIDLETLLQSADVVSLHLSSKQENDNYLNRDCLELMKDDSILINTARGSVLDYIALEEALKNGKFLGVGLDVFDTEPLLSSALTKYSNVILTPHVAYMTNESLDKMNHELLVNLKASVS